ncbi:MAG: hypothetical protein LV481_11565 [Methylacidiphilales bacterium]|nr:hypothetical protein [Candidatus Methylacidiphilales bacterium]
MTRDEAKLLLQAMRPDGSDTNDPAFAGALSQVQTDPELEAWWRAQQKFDRGIATKIEEIPVPLSLRDDIIGRRKIIVVPRQSFLGACFAVAAALVLVAVIQNVLYTGPAANPPMLSDAYTASVLPVLGDDKPELGMTSSDHERVQAWLKERDAPTGNLPANLAALPSVGCQTFEVRGHTVSLICFALKGGGLAHLFIVNERALIDPPGDLPEYAQAGGWSTASWSEDGKSYVLATRAGPEALHALL